MKYPEFLDKVSEKAGVNKSLASKVVKSFVTVLQTLIQQGERISISGLGTYKVKARKGKMARNPRTGEKIPVPEGRKISFKPSMKLRSMVKKSG